MLCNNALQRGTNIISDQQITVVYECNENLTLHIAGLKQHLFLYVLYLFNMQIVLSPLNVVTHYLLNRDGS